ncbi:MAG: DNA polymerase III subunit beta [Planctomycetaceae bacterium]|nr:DNA polymerase III subunit beta [Planctomycetaceae bacterium]
MKFSTERNVFSQAFQLVSSVAAMRDVKPVLQNVKVKADADGLVLMATDGEMGIRAALRDCTVGEPGEAIIPLKRMRMILQESPSANVDVDSDDRQMTVVCDSSRFQLATQPADEFPDVAPFAETEYHEVGADIFRELVKRTVFATDADSARYALGGVLLEMTDDKITGVATDGRRLACQEVCAKSVGGHHSEGSAIVPPKVLSLLERALSGNDQIKIHLSGNRITTSLADTTLFSRLIEGRFPKWRNIIPEVTGRMCVPLAAGPFYSAVRQAAIVTSEQQPGVVFHFKRDKLVLQAQGAEIGESVIEMPVVCEGQEISIKLDPSYLVDFLRVIPQDKVIDAWIAADSPVIFKTDDDYSYILMPLT